MLLQSHRRVVLASALLTITLGVFLYIAGSYLVFPWYTEPMEADALQHVARIASGKAPYPADSPGFLPLPYPPFYYLLTAPLYLLIGDSFAGPRIISLLSALGSGWLVFFIARKEGVERSGAIVASALYFASFRLLDAYTLCGLPDSLYSFLIVAGYCAFAYGGTRRTEVLWLVLYTLAFWTKQHGSFLFGFAVVYALLGRARPFPRWVYAVVYVLAVPVAFVTIGPLLGDGFFRHTVEVPAHWKRSIGGSLYRTAYVIAALVPFASMLTASYFRAKWTLSIARLSPLVWFILTGLISVIVSMTATGASNNHYMPLITVLCATAVVGAYQVNAVTPPRSLVMAILATFIVIGAATAELGRNHGLTQWYMPVVAAVLVAVMYAVYARALPALLLFGQFACAAYLPSAYLPHPSYREAQDELKALATATQGNLILAPFGYAPKDLTGVRTLPSPSWVAIDDIRRQTGVSDQKRSVAVLRSYIDSNPTVRILSAGPLAAMEGWDQVATKFELECDYQDTFFALRQVPPHWFGSGGHPRYLYRRKP